MFCKHARMTHSGRTSDLPCPEEGLGLILRGEGKGGRGGKGKGGEKQNGKKEKK